MSQPTPASSRISPLKLMSLFLLIIMTMSILFSSVFYITSVNVLDQRLTGDFQTTQIKDPNHELNEWIGHRTDDSKVTLAQHLIILNSLALLIGIAVSYILARIALRPIERALQEQDRFISDASHELRTPITAALLSNEVALKNPQLTVTQARQVLAGNVSDMQQLKRLSDELLDQTRAKHSNESVSQVSLQAVITQSMTHNKKLALEKNITLTQTVDDVTFYTFAHTASKILTIILENSIKYSSNGTTIAISATATPRDVSIAVKDQGIGISPEDQKHIFDRFYRSDLSRSEHEGYGLGLSIAKDLVVQAKGTISVVSSLGAGSTFTITLPRGKSLVSVT